jgi:hypothetical protein
MWSDSHRSDISTCDAGFAFHTWKDSPAHTPKITAAALESHHNSANFQCKVHNSIKNFNHGKRGKHKHEDNQQVWHMINNTLNE